MRLFNTLTGTKQEFKPLTPGEVRMYVCGITAYDRSHLGHARSAIVFDVLRRWLEARGLRVTFVKNYTDVDDKIIKRAHETGRDWTAVVETYIAAYERDMQRLGVRPPTEAPRATAFVEEMIRLIEALERRGHAYAAGGDVYYSVASFADYGKLSKRNLDALKVGARVEPGEHKRDPLDFALWKAAKPGEPSWPSPWGAGRPGWHIECSTMSRCLLGDALDIHGGGMDLIFPHHENEIAQSEGVTGKPFARFWVHNGFLNVNHEKMSKSLGNFLTIEDLFARVPFEPAVTAEVTRYHLLSTHYHGPLDFSEEGLRAAKAALDNLYRLLQKLPEQRAAASAVESDRALTDLDARFCDAMDDDLNTPQALAALQQFRSAANPVLDRGVTPAAADQIGAALRRHGAVLGLLSVEPKRWPEGWRDTPSAPRSTGAPPPAELDPSQVDALVSERNAARGRRDFARADQIRRQLEAAGVILEDRPDGSTRVRR